MSAEAARMPAEWNAERILALAPDPASAKAGQGLSSAKKWASLGRGDGLIWGECQGSGKDPYQTKIDPDDPPVFSCSCPSRKFPCKHGLGLMLVWAAAPGAVAEGTPPPWVVSWRDMRAKKAEAKKEKAERPATPVDLAAQAKREAARAAKVAAGLDDLALWISDLVRQGFTALGAKSATLWDEQARRLVDAQAPGVARKLRQIDDMARTGEGWQADLLDRLARLHLMIEGFRRLDALPTDVADDLRAAIGFPTDLDAVRAGPGVRDRWQVIGHSFALEDKVLVRRSWMLGRATGRPALVLDFAAGNRPLDPGPTPGTELDADLAFFPGRLGLRALVKERHAAPEEVHSPSGATSIDGAFSAYGEALARCPWLELWPVALADVVLQEGDETWSVRDPRGSALPLSRRFARGWHLMALSGGSPFTLCGEFDGATLDPLGVWIGGRYVPVVISQMQPLETMAVAPPVPTPMMGEAAASALVGVDRKPPPAADGPIAAALRGVEAREPTSRLLAVAAAVGLHGRSGRKPSRDPNPAPETCPAEAQPECSPEAAARLRRIFGGEYAEVLPEWLGLLAASGRRPPYDAIVQLLEHQTHLNLPVEPLIRGLGTRGRWLAARNPLWKKYAGLDDAADPASVWETGDRHERLAALRALRASDPAAASALVASTFASEPAAFRAVIVEELEPGLSMADEPFLEACLDDRGKEVRERAASLLRKLPDSRLVLRMIERAKAILSMDGGTLVVKPPSACDKATARDGISPDPSRVRNDVGKRAIWLDEVLSAIAPTVLAREFGLLPEALIEAGRGGEWEGLLWTAWATGAARVRDLAWAEPLLARRPRAAHKLHDFSQDRLLFTLLPPDRRDAFLRGLFEADPGPLKTGHPAYFYLDAPYGQAGLPGVIVGLDIAREIVRRVAPILDEERRAAEEEREQGAAELARSESRRQDYRGWHFLRSLGAVLPPEFADEASAILEVDDGPRPFYADAYGQMLGQLTFRRDMHREFAP